MKRKMPKKYTKDEFIERAREVHGNKYDYSKVEYSNSITKVCIICPKHGEFWQRPQCHLQGDGCPKCKGEKNSERLLMITEEFVEKAKKIHGNKYDYSKVNYINAITKVCIICPKHGEFWQKPYSHLSGHGCQKCGIDEISKKSIYTTKEWVKKAKKIHGDKYDYSKVDLEHRDNKGRICIICPMHGEFWIVPKSHLQGVGCKKCYDDRRGKSQKNTKEEFIKKAREVHGDKYDYSKVNYINAHTRVCINCSKHGEFWQTPNVHLTNHGCPYCKSSRLENEFKVFLDKHKINYYFQKRFNWLGRQSLDFYLPDYNIGIECQGIQHFVEKGWNKKDKLKDIIKRDLKKQTLCLKNGINILYYTNIKLDNYPYKVFKDKKILLEYIKNEK